MLKRRVNERAKVGRTG